MKELKIWLRYTSNSFQQTLSNKPSIVIFLLGKILRISLFTLFLNYLFTGANGLAGYTKEQAIFFFLTFNFIGTASQMLFREAYRFRSLIVTGNFDFILLKPLNPLVRVLLGGGDFIDLIMIIALALVTFWYGTTYITTDIKQWLMFAVLTINGLLISASLYTLVLGLGVITTSIDHLIMVYRDFESMLRIPVDLYTEPIRSFLLFVLPVGIMMSFPAKALIGILTLENLILAFGVCLAFTIIATQFWKWSLKHYSSASS